VLIKRPSLIRRSAGFTLVEVMMASVILVVGFIGMIEAVALSSQMMDNARRQTLANQMINHEFEQLRLQPWNSTSPTAGISRLPAGPTTLGAAWVAGTTYYAGDTVTYSGAWYRCSQQGAGQNPSTANSAYWNVDTPPYAVSPLMDTSGNALGATYSMTRSVATLVSDSNSNAILCEITLTVTWVVKTSRRDSLNTFGNELTFKYSRTNVGYFGKNGLSLSYQRS
jgi:prepilin-type N-terminal cleavage/methylation domain-containing protein